MQVDAHPSLSRPRVLLATLVAVLMGLLVALSYAAVTLGA